jgi:hypothetical protein
LRKAPIIFCFCRRCCFLHRSWSPVHAGGPPAGIRQSLLRIAGIVTAYLGGPRGQLPERSEVESRRSNQDSAVSIHIMDSLSITTDEQFPYSD